MSTNRSAHLVELAHVFAGTPIASEWAQRSAETRRVRKAQLHLPGLQSKPAAADIEQQRAEMRSDLMAVLRSLGANRREVSVDEIAALGLPLLLELQEILAALPGGANPAVLAKVAAAKLRLTAKPSAVHNPRRGGPHGA